jgi:hypothetical protein
MFNCMEFRDQYCNFVFHLNICYNKWCYILCMRSVYTAMYHEIAVMCMCIKYVHVNYIYIYVSLNNFIKYMLLVIFLLLLSFFSNPPTLHYFMPFRNISCSNFTTWCNNLIQHTILTHTLTLSLVLQILI